MRRVTDQNWRVRRIDLCGLGACVLAAGVTYWTVVRPIFNAQIDQRSMAMTLARDAAEIERTRAGIAETERLAESVRAKIERADVQLLSIDQLNTRLGELSETARRSGVVVQTMRPRPAIVGPRFSVTPIELKGTGGYRAVDALIAEMHHSLRDLRVNALEIEAQRAIPGTTDGNVSDAEFANTGGAFSIEVSWFADGSGNKRAEPVNRP
jgi:Tfp pilus assembly protein PilO